MDCEREISEKCENESDSNVSKKGSLLENCKALNAESASTGQPEHVVIADGNSQKNVGSRHHPAVAKESDGGWGWVIVFGAFFVTTLAGGVAISFSLLYMEFVDLFGAPRAVVGWIGSLHYFISNVLGTNDSCLLCVNLVQFCCIDARMLL